MVCLRQQAAAFLPLLACWFVILSASFVEAIRRMPMNYRSFTSYSISSFTLFVLLCLTANSVAAQTTAFTYQGKLVDNGNLANTSYDMQFKLFDAASNGNQIGATLTFDGTGSNPPAVAVSNGSFAVNLDFGTCPPSSSCFDGSPRFLEVAVKPHGSGSYTPLSPRQTITTTPYAMKSLNATTATTADGLSLACVSCITSSQIQSVNGSAVTGTIPVASVPTGSGN